MKMLDKERLLGRAQIVVSAASFGTIGVFAKIAYAAGVSAPLLLELRFIIAAMALWTYFLAFDRRIIKVSKKQLATCAALGLAGYGIFSNLVFTALESTPATIVGLLFFCYPVFVLLLDWFIIRQRPHLQLRLGALLILGGIAVGVFGTAAAGITLGWLLAIAGAAWYAAYIVATRKLLTNLKPQSVALYVTSFAALGFSVLGGPVSSNMGRIETSALIAVISLALVSTVLALLSLFSGLEKLGSAEASQIGSVELIVSLTLASTLLGETITLPVILGAGLVMAGVFAGQLKPRMRDVECPQC
jgi:drug/metabolite transporter (DMT)-like permease